MSRLKPFGFDVALRFELASEEDRPLFLSYVVASLLALTWLVLVHVVPVPLLPILVTPDVSVITFAPEPVAPATPSVGVRSDRQRAGSRGAPSLRDVFTRNAGLVDAGNILRGVDVEPTGSTPREATGRKVGLGTGAGSRTPGLTPRGGLSVTGAGVGEVRGGGVSRHVVSIGAPEVRPVAGGSSGGSAVEMGQTARAHVPQLARCYHDEGLSRNASLGGLVRLAITVEAGRVTSAHIVDRTWVGAGVAEAESCLLRTVRGWRLGGSDARIVLPLSFTSPTR